MLKQKIALEERGIREGEQELLYNGERLIPWRTLAEYNIGHVSTLDCTLPRIGGCSGPYPQHLCSAPQYVWVNVCNGSAAGGTDCSERRQWELSQSRLASMGIKYGDDTFRCGERRRTACACRFTRTTLKEDQARHMEL